MDDGLFWPINTAISTREAAMLTKEQLDFLLSAEDRERMALILNKSHYRLDKESLGDVEQIEQALNRELIATYDFAFKGSPVAEVVQIFSLRYTYHNLKVLLKARAMNTDLSQLLLPIGRYSLDILEHLVTTLSSDRCPKVMIEEVSATWLEYQGYQDIRILDIGMDMAYFKHLNQLARDLEHSELTRFVCLTIEFYNAITVKRGLDQGKPRSFMRQLLSGEGLWQESDYLKLYEGKSLASWFSQVYPDSFERSITSLEKGLEQASLSATELEYWMDFLRFQVLDQGRFEFQGPLPLARYLWGKEMEVKNLRLILTGRCHGLRVELLKERMRPVYGS